MRVTAEGASLLVLEWGPAARVERWTIVLTAVQTETVTVAEVRHWVRVGLVAVIEPVTAARLPVEAVLRERESSLLTCSEALRCFRSRSIRSTRPQEDHRSYLRSWTPFEWAVVCISGSSVRIGYRETSCHIWSSSSHNCCRQSVFDPQT